jgi:hypothetical protein
MKLKNIKYYLTLFIQVIRLCMLVYTKNSTHTFYLSKHLWAMLRLVISVGVYVYNLKWGVYVEGLILLMGMFGFLSLHYSIVIHTHSIGIGSISVPVFYGQYSYFFMLIVHIVISFGQYYLLYKKLFSSNK